MKKKDYYIKIKRVVRSTQYTFLKETIDFWPLSQNCLANPGKFPLKIVWQLFN